MSQASNAFDMSRMAMGGLGQVMDSVELMKRAWSSMNLPSTLVPTVDIEELDKRIADLKAVEQWLNVNLGMLRGTIQGLEIQRGTLAAVRAFGASVGVSAPHADPQAAAQMRADAAVQAMERAVGSRSRPDAATRTATPAPRSEPPAPAAARAPQADRAVEPGNGSKDPRRPTDATGSADAGGSKGAKAPSGGSSGDAALAPMLAGINPGAWWNLLQQNFNQVAEAALSGVGLQGAALRDAAVAAAGGSGGATGTPGSTRKAGAKGTAGTAGTAGTKGATGAKGPKGGGRAGKARPSAPAGRRSPVR
jgi:hypothetical protein